MRITSPTNNASKTASDDSIVSRKFILYGSYCTTSRNTSLLITPPDRFSDFSNGRDENRNGKKDADRRDDERKDDVEYDH